MLVQLVKRYSQCRIARKVPFSVTFGTGPEMLKNGLLPEGCSKLKSRQQRKPCHRKKTKPGIERVQALADISRSCYVAIATQPVHRRPLKYEKCNRRTHNRKT